MKLLKRKFPKSRLRRTRMKSFSRKMVSENNLTANDVIWPVFLSEGDKSKTEIGIDKLIKEHYPKAQFIGFVDGIGWYVRKSDLRRMVSAYEDVYTFHKQELQRFEKLLIQTFIK